MHEGWAQILVCMKYRKWREMDEATLKWNDKDDEDVDIDAARTSPTGACATAAIVVVLLRYCCAVVLLLLLLPLVVLESGPE